MIKDSKHKEWEDSYSKGHNNILYPQTEVVKFLNRNVRKKMDSSGNFTEILKPSNQNRLRCLDFACGLGVHSILCEEFEIECFGVDISKTAIHKAQKNARGKGFNELSDRFLILDESKTELPFIDNYFDFAIAESCLDSMYFEIASEYYKEIKRVTKKYIYFSLIAADSEIENRFEDIVLDRDLERGTIQSYFNLDRINELIGDDFKNITELVKKTESEVLKKGSNIESRYYGVIDLESN
tara:strand:- start:965 stop:1684 length:720 start_codon:yes stop_codon:yes gene_type:complete